MSNNKVLGIALGILAIILIILYTLKNTLLAT